MLKIDNTYITTPFVDILHRLRADLAFNNIHLFGTIKERNDNIYFSCPAHKAGQESHPSAGMLIIDKDNTKAGMVHCFQCGYIADLPQMISYCFRVNDNGAYGKRWLKENFEAPIIVKEPHNWFPALDLVERKQKAAKAALEAMRKGLPNPVGDNYEIQTLVTEDELRKYRYTHRYMYERKLTDEVIEMFDVGYDPKTKCLTFPVYDTRNRCVAVARRSVLAKYFHYPTEIKKPVYGLNIIEHDIHKKYGKKIIICESIIDALTCWSYGKPAVALMGTGSYRQLQILKKSSIYTGIVAFDGDEAGRERRKWFQEVMNDNYTYGSWYELPEGKDINDLSKEEFDALEHCNARFSMESPITVQQIREINHKFENRRTVTREEIEAAYKAECKARWDVINKRN